MNALAQRAAAGLVQLAIAFGVCLFGAAGTLDFWQAWVFIGLFLGAAASITAYLWRSDRSLLQRRVNAGAGADGDRFRNGSRLSRQRRSSENWSCQR